MKYYAKKTKQGKKKGFLFTKNTDYALQANYLYTNMRVELAQSMMYKLKSYWS